MSADADGSGAETTRSRLDGPPKTWAIETETADDGEQHLATVEGEHGDVAAVVYVRDDADLGHLRGVLHDLESEVRHLTHDGDDDADGDSDADGDGDGGASA